MVKKNDACNYFSDSFEVTEIDRFLRRMRTEQKMPGLGLLHLVSTVYLRVLAKYPELNRFVSGQRIYARYNPEIVMSIKVELKAEAPETSIKVPLDVSYTLADVYAKINNEIDKARNGSTATDDTADIFMKLPRLVLKFAVFVLRLLDYFGKLPMSIINASPFHGSLIITDMASIGVPAIYHHLYNFGNLPLFITIGAKYKKYEPDKNNVISERKYFDLALVTDERTTDGFYFSQAYKYFKYLMKNPEELLVPPEEITEDIM